MPLLRNRNQKPKPHLVTSNKARKKRHLPLCTGPDGTPVQIYVEQKARQGFFPNGSRSVLAQVGG